MNTYYIEVRAHVDGSEDLDGHSDQVMDALLEESNIVDPDIGVDFESSMIDVCMYVTAGDQAEALSTGMAALRSAVHRLGVHTPGWENSLRDALTSVRPSTFAEAG